ncbi:MAG: hypothetical protein HY270_20530 [Deltaproteobacteria bacterium]|nr:hypothetical protein [Deltaproteobacteria bacterium]
MPTNRRSLTPRRHAVFELAAGLLLVFKPQGHREAEHRHPYGQRLRVVRGALRVDTTKRSVVLRANSRPLTVVARRLHATRALHDTWLVVERIQRS